MSRQNGHGPTYEEQMNRQEEAQAHQAASSAASRVAASKLEETYKNPDFFSELGDADVDSDLHNWVSDELGPAFSSARISGNMDEDFPRRRDLLNANASERYISERSPGRCLRQNPKLLALSQGLTGTEQYPDPTKHPDFRAPTRPGKNRVIREAHEVKTLQESLSAEGQGVESVTTATSESRVVGKEDEAKSGITGKLSGVFS